MNVDAQSLYGEIITKIGQSLPVGFDMSAFYPRAKTAGIANETSFAEILTEALEELTEETPAAESYIDDAAVVSSALANTVSVSGAKITQEVYDAILASSAKYNLDTNLVKAVIQQESYYDQYSLSKSGAMGLMQLMPGTAEGLGVTDAYDVNQNIEGGTRYLREMLDMFGGDVSLALAAYNAGPNAVKRYGGIPPYDETIDYVPKVLGYQAKYADKMSVMGEEG